ncbi:MAG: hypothetical protein VB934_06945 [Polyangiaceae bacterium]
MRRVRGAKMAALALLALLVGGACAPKPPVGRPAIVALSSGLEAYQGPGLPTDRQHRQALLYAALVKERPWCAPPLDEVFRRPARGLPERLIGGRLPHYEWYLGPIRYRIGASRSRAGEGARWSVRLNVAIEPPSAETLELPDCGLGTDLDGPVVCEGTPYERAEGVEACPDSGTFRVPATRRNIRALLERWSTAIEAYYNRDAKRYGVPVRYDFHFFLVDDVQHARRPIDLRVSLASSCGRTPYFGALRSGWSIPVLAHEMGHYLGLLDEYEALSGVSALYPKKPFAGSEGSRMGLSMKTHTQLWPLHHYLVLRRYHCDHPVAHDEWPRVLIHD